MCDIIKKMNHKIPEALFWNYILLAAYMAKTANDGGSTIQAILLLAFRGVAQNKFLLK